MKQKSQKIYSEIFWVIFDEKIYDSRRRLRLPWYKKSLKISL